MRNTSITWGSARSPVFGATARTVFFGFLLLLGSPLHSSAEDFKPEKFDKALLEDSIKEQAILREEMVVEQAILREEMEQIRLEMQRIMEEIKLAMKVEALKLKAELEGLKEETQRIQKEILATLEKSKQDFLEGKEEMQRGLKKMQQEAKAMTKEIKEVLEDQKAVWKQETAALQGSLVDARKEMDSAKVNSDEILQSSRLAIRKFQQEKVVTMTDSRSKSNAAMFEARSTLQKSQNDYKLDSTSVNKELMADIKETREDLKRRQKTQKRNSKKSQNEVLAALKSAKKKRIAELKRDSSRKKVQKKKISRPKKKRIQKQQRKRPILIAKVEEQIVEKLDQSLLDIEDEGKLVKTAEAAAETSEELLKKEVSRLSTNITDLKKELKKANGDPGTLLAKLGDAYLTAQRFMSSQTDDEERQKLLDLSDSQGLLLGSYEQAAWAYKLSLDFNHKSAETHLKIGKIYDEMEDGKNAIMYAKLAHQIFKRHHNSSQMKEAQTFIETLTAKYVNAS